MATRGMGVALVSAGAAVTLALVVVAAVGSYVLHRRRIDAQIGEAKNALGQLAMDAASAYESDRGDGKRHLCPSASKPVPANPDAIRGKAYLSSPSDWTADREAHAGFACLAFEVSEPQHYQYSYEADDTHFVARARGDLDGDGVLSTFECRGHLVGDRLMIDPVIAETSPDE